MKERLKRHTTLAVLVAGLSIWATLPCLAADYATTLLGYNPLAYYRLNETAPVPPGDVAVNSGRAGEAATGAYVGSTSMHPIGGALVGSTDTAALFDGSGARVVVPFTRALPLSPPFTVEAWVNPAVAPPPSGQSSLAAVLSYGHLADPRSGWLIYQAAAGWNFRLYNQNGLNTSVSITGGPAPVAGTWYHLAAVYDGTTAQVFVNGVLQASGTPTGFVPNTDGSFTIGTRSDVAFNYNGNVDEVALYTNALSAAELLAHYQNGINPSPSQAYDQLVLAQNPVAYYRLGEGPYSPPDPSTLPVAQNLGSLGASANGIDQPGTQTRAEGPPCSGLGAGNLACSFNGISGFIDCGTNPGFDITGPLTVTAWLKVNRLDKTWQAIVTKGDSAWRLHRNGDTRNLGFGTSGLSNQDQAGTAILNDGQWHHIAAVYDGSSKRLYMDGLLDTSVAATGTIAVNTYSLLIGENAQATSRFFAGTIDEVAVLDRALTAQEIRDLFYSANPPPVILQQPSAPSGQIIAGAPVTLSVLASGAPTLSYQWLKGGTQIAGQTTSSLSFPNITTNDAGSYAVVITNNYGAVTSSVAALSVSYPTQPATLLRAVGYPLYDPATRQATLTQVILEFSGPLAAEGGNPARYAVSDGTPLTVTAAQFANLNMTVVLTTSGQTQGALYNVTVTGVTDGVGNPLTSNTAQFRAWVSSPLNGISFEYFASDGTASPPYAYTDVGALTNNSLFPDSPSLVTNLWAFDSRIIFPDDSHDVYGARMRGVFVPRTSGAYRFYLRSDDASQVYLNPNGADPAGKQRILNEPGCCGDWNKFASPAFSLTAGQSYYIEMLYKEGGGGDYGKVAALLEPAANVTNYPPLGTANTAVDPASLAGPAIGYPYAPADAAGSITIVGPSDATVQANHAAVFTVAASNPAGWPMTYQWLRNGSPVQGATDSTYLILAVAGDNNARFSVRVSMLGSVVVSSQATLTVQSDTDVPAVAETHGSTALNTFLVGFSQRMGTPSPASFSIAGFITTSATLDSTGTNVIVTLDRALTPGQTYTINIQNVADFSGTVLPSATASLRAFLFSRGLLRFAYWGGLPAGTPNDIGQLTVNPRYPNSPDWIGFVSGFDSRSIFPDDTHAGYGGRISGWFMSPADTNYIFYLRSDDSSQLYINPTGADPAMAALLQEETGCCHGFADLPTLAIPMTSGQLYYVEAIYKEGNGGDYLQVAAQPEGSPRDPNSLLPVSKTLVGSLEDPIGASVTITQQPPNAVGVYLGARLDGSFNGNNGAFTVVNYGTPVGPWSYSSATGSWTNHGSADCGGPYGTGLRSPVLTVRTSGTVTLSLAHRYSFEFDASTDWDGGQVRLSVNGGPFATVPSANFAANGYVGPIQGTVHGGITASPGWVNEAFIRMSDGYANRTLITSVATLGTFNAGDSIQLEFVSSWDECSEGTEPNWEIDSVQLTGGDTVLATAVSLSVGAVSTFRDMPNPYMSYFWQRDTGSGFTDISGVDGSMYSFYASLADSGTRYRCIVYGPGAVATSEVATVTVTLALTYTRPTANAITLSWPLPPPPLTPTSFVLEQSPTLQTGSWTTVPPASYQITSDTVSVTVTIQSGQSVYYRLHRM